MGDLERFKVLCASIKKYNVDKIPFYVSIPSEDYSKFKKSIKDDSIIYIKDEAIVPKLGQSNWYTQQEVKASFWKTGIANNYVMLDSDMYFTSNFFMSGFLYNNIPYTVMHENKVMNTWMVLNGKQDAVNQYKKEFNYIKNKLCLSTLKTYYFGGTPVVWSSKVWESLEDKYLKPNNLEFWQLIDSCPNELAWYGAWLFKDGTIPIIPVDEYFKIYHYSEQYEQDINSEITKNILKAYKGICMQSNWKAPTLFGEAVNYKEKILYSPAPIGGKHMLPKYKTKIYGILMIKDEEDILEGHLNNVVRWCSDIYVLIGTENKDALEKELDILNKFSQIKYIEYDKNLPPINDSSRQFILDKIRQDNGYDNWVAILHADERHLSDPTSFLSSIEDGNFKRVVAPLVPYFLHSGDKPKWGKIKHLPLEERVTHYMWPGTPEARFFFDKRGYDYNTGLHGKTTPRPKIDEEDIWTMQLCLKQYNYRSPEQALERAKGRSDSGWQSNHYKHILDGHIFIDDLNVPGYDLYDWDQHSVKSKPYSEKELPLQYLYDIKKNQTIKKIKN